MLVLNVLIKQFISSILFFGKAFFIEDQRVKCEEKFIAWGSMDTTTGQVNTGFALCLTKWSLNSVYFFQLNHPENDFPYSFTTIR